MFGLQKGKRFIILRGGSMTEEKYSGIRECDITCKLAGSGGGKAHM